MTEYTVPDSDSPRNAILIITAAARAAVARIAGALKAARLAFRIGRKITPQPLVDVTFCVRCHEVISDGDLCDTCTEVVARENADNIIRRHRRQMVERTGESNPYRAHDILMAQYLAGK